MFAVMWSFTSMLLLMASSAWEPTLAHNPGISLRLSEPFFNYVLHDIINPLIKSEISKITLPDISYHVSGLNFDIFLSQLKPSMESYSFQDGSYMMPDAKLSALDMQVGFFISGSGKWRTRARWWPYITESGNVYFYTRPMWVRIGISISPGADGLWNFTVVDFYANCNLDIKFTGDGMSGIDVGALRKYISGEVNGAVNVKLRQALITFLENLTPMMRKYLPYLSYANCTHFGIPNCQDFAVNLSLTSPGVWKQNCSTEIQLNGYLLYKDRAYLPIPADPFPPQVGCGEHSVAMLFSGGTFSSLVAAVVGSELVHGNFPTEKFADDSYYDRYIPGLKKYGHLPLYANLTLLNSSISLTAGKEMRVEIGAYFGILVDTTPAAIIQEKVFEEAFGMNVTVTVGLTAWLSNITTPEGVMSLMFMNFSTSVVDGVTLLHSSIGPIDLDQVHELMQQLMNKGFANADEFLSKGMLIIPNHVSKYALHNPQLIIAEDYVKLAISVGEYNATSDWFEQEARRYSPDWQDILFKSASRVDIEKVPRTVPGAARAFMDAMLGVAGVVAETTKDAFLKLAGAN